MTALLLLLVLQGELDVEKVEKLVKLKKSDGSNHFAFSGDGKYLVGESGDLRKGKLLFWEIPSGKMLKELKTKTGLVAIAGSSDGKVFLAANNNSKIEVWDLKTLRRRRELSGHKSPINCVAVSKDGKYGVSGGTSSEAFFWDLSRGKGTKLKEQSGDVTAVAYSPDGTQVAVGSADGTIRLFETRRGKVTHTLSSHNDRIGGMKFTEDGKTLYSAGNDGKVVVWNAEKGTEIKSISASGDELKGIGLTSKYIISAGTNGVIHFWDIKTYASAGSVNVKERIDSVDVDPTGKYIAVYTADREILLYGNKK